MKNLMISISALVVGLGIAAYNSFITNIDAALMAWIRPFF